MSDCPVALDYVERAAELQITQYRDSIDLNVWIASRALRVGELNDKKCEIFSGLDLLTATGEQLRFIGGWLGVSWATASYTFSDDELYRRFILASQIDQGVRSGELQAAQILFGPSAYVARMRKGTVVLAIGRSLTQDERDALVRVESIFPVPLGAILQINEGDVFGFCAGYGGLCASNFGA